MELLRARPVSRHEDDGVRAVYECQSCYRTYEGVFDPYDTPDKIPCTSGCGGDEEEEGES